MSKKIEGVNADVDTIVEVRDATVTYDMERGVSRVLNNVSVDIQREEILGVVGESGSGKSMFASALLDAVPPPGQLGGEIRYYPTDEEPVDILSLSDSKLNRYRWEHISMVFQGAMSSFNPTMKIRGHFEETLSAHDAGMDDGMERTRELLSSLYLDPDRVLDSYPHELSGGMKQRALIALSLVLEPQVLVMDEPTAALDLLMQRSIMTLLSELQEEYELTLVFITHDLPLVADLCDRISVLYAFQFVELGPTREILTNARHPYTRALLNATPNLNSSLEDMRPIEGSSPDPVNVPQGCSYHPRCPLATEECEASDPAYHEVSDTHRAACIHWDEAADAIQLQTTEGMRQRRDDVQHGIEMIEGSGDSGPDGAADSPVVSLKNVEVHFVDEKGLLDFFSEPEVVRAVDDVSLDIYENDVVSLVGESGCGKTTLGKAAIGLERPTGGSIKFRGQDIWDAKDKRNDVSIPYETIRKSLQIIHQDPGASLNPNKRVRETLAAPLLKWQTELSREDREARLQGMLETVGMTPPSDYIERFPHQLSGGEKQRVALVRALLMNPELILADEAISALDVSLRIEMMDLLLDLQDRFDTSILFISHDLSNARYLAKKAGGRIGVMYLGEIVELGPAEQIVSDPRHPYTQALKWGTPNLSEVRESPGDLPLRTVDVPDPVDPPSGCRFHTRCPEAREICTHTAPPLIEVGDGQRSVSCFRADDNHEYWESQPLDDGPGVQETSPDTGEQQSVDD